jgi:hypothetical protein
MERWGIGVEELVALHKEGCLSPEFDRAAFQEHLQGEVSQENKNRKEAGAASCYPGDPEYPGFLEEQKLLHSKYSNTDIVSLERMLVKKGITVSRYARALVKRRQSGEGKEDRQHVPKPVPSTHAVTTLQHSKTRGPISKKEIDADILRFGLAARKLDKKVKRAVKDEEDLDIYNPKTYKREALAQVDEFPSDFFPITVELLEGLADEVFQVIEKQPTRNPVGGIIQGALRGRKSISIEQAYRRFNNLRRETITETD